MRRGQLVVLVTLLVAYASLYLCRANLEAAMPLLIAEGVADKTSLGQLSSIATFTYAIGKIVMGTVGDVIGGKRLMLVAVTGSVVCSLLFGLQHAFVAFVVFAAANRFFQSGGWAGLVHVVSRRFEAARHGSVMGILSTSYDLGNIAALALSGFVARWGWRTLFVVNPLLLAVVGGAAVLSIRPAPPAADAPAGQPPEPPEERVPLGVILRHLFSRGTFFLALVLGALITFIRIAFLTWTPTFLYEVSGKGAGQASASIFKSIAFPAAGVVASLTVGFLSDKLGPGRRAPIMAVSLAVVVVLVLVLGHGVASSPYAVVPLLFAIGLFVLGPYSLPAGAVALDVAGKRGASTAAGLIDGAGYLGATASGFVLGGLADKSGWSAAFDVIAAVALAAALVSAGWAVVVARRRA
jgi:OPA family glycerol-3-phosphate transporter-like MFS transporter